MLLHTFIDFGQKCELTNNSDEHLSFLKAVLFGFINLIREKLDLF